MAGRYGRGPQDVRRLISVGPVVAKPVADGSSVSVHRADSLAELERIAPTMRVDGGDLLVEPFLPGREFTVGVVGDQVLPVVEIELSTPLFDYAAKYQPCAVSEMCPAPIPKEFAPRLQQLALRREDAPVARLRDAVCDLLRQYWAVAIEPVWPQMRLVLEADTTYRARQLALGGARLLFADMHPNLRWQGGELYIHKMISRHRVAASGRGLLLLPSVFAHKPAPPVSPDEPPSLVYPSRGVATLWGSSRARLLSLLEEPLPTVELARRLRVTRTRGGRHVLYRRGTLGDRLTTTATRP